MTFEQHQQAIDAAAAALNRALMDAATDGIATVICAELWRPSPHWTKCAVIRHVQMSRDVKPHDENAAPPPPKPR